MSVSSPQSLSLRGRRALIVIFDYDHTALIFAYIERIFFQEDRKAAVESSIATLEGFLPKLRDVGFTDMVMDESYEIPRDLIRGIVDPPQVSTTGTTLTLAQLLKEFQDECSTLIQRSCLLSQSPRFITMMRRCGYCNPVASNYLVTFMRMITSTQIQSEPETYEPFLIHPDTGETMGVREFCKVVVEVLGKEAGEHTPYFLVHVCFAMLKLFFTQIMYN